MKTPNLNLAIQPKTFVLYRGKAYFYLGVSGDGMGELLLPDSDTIHRVPTQALRIASGDRLPTSRFLEFEDYPPEKQEIAKKRYDALQPVLEKGPTKSTLRTAADLLGMSPTAVRRMFERYVLCGQRLTALIPRVFSYGVINRKLTREQMELLQREIKNFYLKEERPSHEQAVERIQRTCRNEGVEVIGRSSIIGEIRGLASAEVVEARLGRKAAREMFRRHRGKSPNGDHPLGLVQIDHTQVDLFGLLPSEKAYRPWITVAIDTYSRMVLGFYLTFEPPSQLSVGLCLYRSMCPKFEWLRRYGITTDWPCYGRWQSLIADNAREFRGYFLQEVALEYGIHVAFRGVGNPNWGAHIERLMGHIATDMHALMGTSFSNPVEKGEYESAGRAVFTLDQLEEIFLHLFVEAYHHSPHEGLGGRTPISVWRDYFEGQVKGAQVHYPQVQAGQPLLISLLPHFRRTIQQDGVSWEGNQYFEDVLTSYIRERNPKRTDGLWRFHFDPRDISKIWWRDPASGAWFPIPLRDVEGQGVALWDLKDFQSMNRQDAAITIDQATVDKGRNAVDRMTQESASVSLKEHRKRRAKARVVPPGPDPLDAMGESIRASSTAAPKSSLPVLNWTPSEYIDPEVFEDPGAFEVEPLRTYYPNFGRARQ